MAENRNYQQFLPNMGRVDYLHALAYNQGYQISACDGGLNFLFVDVEVGVDVLHVVVILERLDHAQHLLRLRAAELDVILRHARLLPPKRE